MTAGSVPPPEVTVTELGSRPAQPADATVSDAAGGPDAVGEVAPDAVFPLLRSDRRGLSVAEAAARLAEVGPNRISPPPASRWVVRLLANFTHLMAVLLWVGGALAFLAGLPELGVAVWLVNVLNGAFSFWQEHKAERATEALRSLLPTYARVLRDGEEVRVIAEELVPGDVMVLAEGDRVCADGRLVEAHELRVDQSTLTGESHPARRTAEPVPAGAATVADRRNRVFAGTSVASGRGVAVVTATGMATEFGALAGLTQGMTRERSPLQVELEHVSRVVGAVAVGSGVAFFVLAEALTPMGLTRGLVFALGMIVAFVPEGLLPTVTLALAMGTQRMAHRHALVKRLSAVEALGATTVICTDKTGTLTENQMTARSVWTASGVMQVSGDGYEPRGGLVVDGHPVEPSPEVHELALVAAMVNDASLVAPDPEHPRWGVRGDPTEGALVVLATKLGVDVDTERRRRPRVGERPFDSARRRMSTLHRSDDGRVVTHVKGAPVDVLDRCVAIRTATGDVELDDARRREVLAANDAFGRDALRVLAVATGTPGASGAPPTDPDEVESGLVLLGLVGLLDPPRPAVAAAVATCRRAGIRIVMMTGDYGLTAESVARRIGLIGDERPRIVNGDELDRLGDDELTLALDGEIIFARTAPEQKLRIVTALQAAGHVVAVTGDGVNDAPALKRADVGVAMGRSGTDVAREAADLVLLDDDFATIVAAVEEGRAVYANIAKFTGYIFTSNTPEAVPFVIFGLSGGRIPPALDVMHILAVDLGTDLVPALALGAEPPEPGLMDRPPRRRDDHVIDRHLLVRSYLWLGPVQAAIVMVAFFATYWASGYAGRWLDLPDAGAVYDAATAAALTAVVTTQIGNLVAHRSDTVPIRRIGLGGNPLLWWGVATELVVIVAIVYLPPLRSVIGTAPFPAWMWIPLAAVAPALLVVDELRKLVAPGPGRPGRRPR